jgi:hypothetical protein
LAGVAILDGSVVTAIYPTYGFVMEKNKAASFVMDKIISQQDLLGKTHPVMGKYIDFD